MALPGNTKPTKKKKKKIDLCPGCGVVPPGLSSSPVF